MTYIAAENRYENMCYRPVDRSGLALPALSPGLRLWHKFDDSTSIDTQRAMLRTAFDLGINHFDLANNLGPPYGSAETNFDQLLEEDFSAEELSEIDRFAVEGRINLWEKPSTAE